MATLATLRARARAVQGQESKLAVEAITETSEAAADLVASQLALGQQKDGKYSNFVYSPLTIALKEGKSGLSGVVDHLTNYDTGASYRQLYAKVVGEQIEFGTTTFKEAAISKRMKGKAFGLTPDSKEEYVRQNVQPVFNKKVKSLLKLP